MALLSGHDRACGFVLHRGFIQRILPRQSWRCRSLKQYLREGNDKVDQQRVIFTCACTELNVFDLHLMEFWGLSPLGLLLLGVSFWVSFWILIEDCNNESFRKLA